MGQFSDQGDESSAIRSVDVGTVSALEDMTKLLVQDTSGVKLTKLCMCKDNKLKDSKFIKVVCHLQKKSGNFGWNVNGKTNLVENGIS